jgi:GT2 family glycosyltransferase
MARGKAKGQPLPTRPTYPDKVAIAYVHGAEVTHSWHQSMMAMVAHDVANNQRVIGGGWMATKYGTGGIIAARNDTVRQFLQMPHVDWLLWVDTDMGFEANALDRLMDAADPDTAPVVGGLCFMMREIGVDGVGGYLVQPAPTVFHWKEQEGVSGFKVDLDYPRDQMVQVAATGSAFILIHKSVFQKIHDKYGPAWYSPVFNQTANQWISEDLSLCIRANALEIPIHVHTGVKTTHYKSLWLDERVFDRLARLDRD